MTTVIAELVDELDRRLTQCQDGHIKVLGTWLGESLKKHPAYELVIYSIYNLTASRIVAGRPTQVTNYNVKARDINASNFGSGSVNARDIQIGINNSTLSDGLKEAFGKAIDTIQAMTIDAADKEDALDGVKKIAEEVNKGKEANPGRIARLWTGLKETLKTAGELAPALVSLGTTVGEAIGQTLG